MLHAMPPALRPRSEQGLRDVRRSKVCWRRSVATLACAILFFCLLGMIAVMHPAYFLSLTGAATPRQMRDFALLLPPLPSELLDCTNLTATGNTTPLAFPSPYEGMWRSHGHLLVLGIQASDSATRREMRDAQRMTWLTYPGVARASNNFTGVFLVLYMAGVATSHAPYVSEAMYYEMRSWEDVAMLNVVIPPVTRHRKPGEEGGYGDAFQATSTRKTVLTLRYLYAAFADTPFLAKGDDDIFVNVPGLLLSMSVLPRVSLSYGKLLSDPPFNYGMLYILSRDVAWEFVTDTNIMVLSAGPYRPEVIDIYLSIRFFNEDVTVGIVLKSVLLRRQNRSVPAFPAPHPEIPEVDGWGAAFMRYMLAPSVADRRGRAATRGGELSVDYFFPQVDGYNPGRVLYVADNCRIQHSLHPVNEWSGVLVQHKVLTLAEHLDSMNFFLRVYRGDFGLRPVAAQVTELEGFAYRVQYCPHTRAGFYT